MTQELVTRRLRLRRWRLSDSAAIRGLWLERDRRSKRLIDAEGHPTVDELRQRVAAQLNESDKTGLSTLAIERRDSPGFIGYCGLFVGDATLAQPEIAFELYRDVHGQGYATEAARAVLDAARATGRSRVWASVRVEHAFIQGAGATWILRQRPPVGRHRSWRHAVDDTRTLSR